MRFAWLCFLSVSFACGAWAADISVTGSWSNTVNKNDLTAGPGSDLKSPIESAAGVATIDISNTSGQSWAVSVARNDIDWPANVKISARRVSDGTGSGTISDGTTYLGLSGASQTLFTGMGDRTGVQIRLKIDGISVKTRPDIYSLNITYTIQSPAP